MKRLFVLAWAVISLTIASCDKADTSAIEARLDAVEKVSIASLQNQVSQINTTIGNLQATQSQLSGFVTNLQTSVGTLEGKYSSLNTEVDNLGKQDAKFEKDIADLAKAVDNCGKDVKKWVEESYTTLTKFSELQEEVSTIKTNIQTIFSRLDGLDSETKRISDSLSDLSTELNEKLGKCEGEIEGIKKDLKALQDDMDTVKAQIAAIVSSVQSVVVVPDYSDGSVKLSKVADNKIYFEVYPLTAAEAIAKVGPSSFSLDYVETLTKSDKELINLLITAVSFDGKMLLVTVDGTGLPDALIEGTKTASARLRISDGTVTRSSEYFPIYRKETDSGSQQNGIAITGESSEIGATYATLYGWSNQEDSAGISVVYGIEYSASDLTTAATTVTAIEKNGDNMYSCKVTGLLWDTLYYYRAFTLYNGVRIYGEVKTFKTNTLSDKKIVFDVGLYSSTKSGKFDESQTFTTSAWFHENATAAAQDFMENETIKWQAAAKNWSADRTYYWPKTGWVNFFSWSGSPSATVSEGQALYEDKTIAIDDDALLASAAYRFSNGSENTDVQSVPTLFHHILSKVTIQVRLDASTLTGNTDADKHKWDMVIEEAALIYADKGSLTVNFTDPAATGQAWPYTGATVGWVPMSGETNVKVDAPIANIGDANTITVVAPNVSPNHILFKDITVMPQDISAVGTEAKIAIKLRLKHYYNNGSIAPQEVEVLDNVIPLQITPVNTWDMNRKYVYTLVVNPTRSETMYDVVVSEWD